MGKYAKDDILKIVKDEGVLFIRLQFADMFGTPKNVEIAPDQLEKALNNEIMFDGSSIEGFVRIEESDMYLRPDIDTFVILPWSSQGGKTAKFICDVYNPDGTPFEGDPRFILKRAIKEAEKLGFSKFNVGPECEFFLFMTDSEGKPTTITHDNAGYFDLAPVDLGGNARSDMVLALQDMGFEIEASHHEVAPGQHEIDFKYEDALKAADNIVTFKTIVKMVAQRHGLHATFMPKPIFGINGSGMHTNMSLFKDNENAFFDPKDNLQLSKDAYCFIGGLMKHAREICGITNPLVNSYKRLVPGYEAPVYIAWSARNRSPLIRIPAKRGSATRLELRCPDPAANPYLALAACLMAGLEGIKNKIQPPSPIDKNIFDMTEEERIKEQIFSLPGSLEEAIKELESSKLVKETLGDHVFERYITAKKIEWDSYRTRVYKWEIDEYLQMY